MVAMPSSAVLRYTTPIPYGVFQKTRCFVGTQFRLKMTFCSFQS